MSLSRAINWTENCSMLRNLVVIKYLTDNIIPVCDPRQCINYYSLGILVLTISLSSHKFWNSYKENHDQTLKGLLFQSSDFQVLPNSQPYPRPTESENWVWDPMILCLNMSSK